MAFSDLGHIADWGPDGVTLKPSNILTEADRTAIAEVSASAGKKGGGRVHIRLQNKQCALDSLARHYALYGRNAGLVAGPQDRENHGESARAKLRAQIEAYAQDIEREREEEARKSASHDASGLEDQPSAVLREREREEEAGKKPSD